MNFESAILDATLILTKCHTCDISRHVVKLPIWHLPLRPYDEAAKTPDDKFFLRFFFSNLLFASDL